MERKENKDEPQSLSFLVRDYRKKNTKTEEQLLWGLQGLDVWVLIYPFEEAMEHRDGIFMQAIGNKLRD